MQIAKSPDRQQTKAPEPVLSLAITTNNRSGESRRDTWPLDTQKGYTFKKSLPP